MSRPPLYSSGAMIVLQLRCSVAQAKRWRELARKSKLERAVWMRHVLDLGTVIEVKTRTTVTVKRRKIK